MMLHKAIALLCAFLLISCSSAKMIDCVSEEGKGIFFRWGVLDAEKKVEGFELDEKGHIRSYTQPKNSLQRAYGERVVGKAQAEVYCALRTEIIDAFLEVQSLHSPGTVSHFVELDNGSGSIRRSLWNPEFETYGSKEFRAIYQQLEELRTKKQ